jgi:hypothetical protein
MGLLSIEEKQSSSSSQPPKQNNDTSSSLDAQPFQKFVSLMHSMKMDILTSPETGGGNNGNGRSTPGGGGGGGSTGSTGSSRPTTLNSLLTTFENILDETSHLSQECTYYQKQIQNIQSQALTSTTNGATNGGVHKNNPNNITEITRDDTTTMDGLSEPDGISTISNLDSKHFVLQFNYIREENQRLKTLLRDMGCGSLLGEEEGQEDPSNMSSNGGVAAVSASAGWYQCHALEQQIQMLEGQNGALGRENELLRQRLDSCGAGGDIGGGIPVGLDKSVDINDLRVQEECRTHIQRQETEFNVLMANKDMECARIQQFVQDLQRERNHLNSLQESTQMALARSEQEVKALNMQANSISNENSRLHAEVISLRQRVNVEAGRANETEKNLYASNLAKNEAMTNVNHIVEERTKLAHEVGQLKREMTQGRQELFTIQDENTRLLGKVKQLETDMQSQMSSVTVLEAERRQNGQQIESLRNALDTAEVENRKVNQELNTIRLNGDFASNKTLELQQIAAKTQYDVEALRKTIVELESEIEALQKMSDVKQMKIHELEDVIASYISNEEVTSDQIRKLVREKAQIVTKLNEANARLQKHVEPLNRKISTSTPLPRTTKGANISIEKKQKTVEESLRKLELSSLVASGSKFSSDSRKSIGKENTHPQNNESYKMNDTLSSLSRHHSDDQITDLDNSLLSHEPLSLLDYLSPEESTRT